MKRGLCVGLVVMFALAVAGLSSASAQLHAVCGRPPSAQRLLVTRTGRAPLGHFRVPARLSVTNARRATTVLASVCDLPRFPKGAIYHCPVDFTLRYRLAFETAAGRLVFTLDPYGCQAVAARGFIRQARPGFWRILGQAVGIANATDATFTASP